MLIFLSKSTLPDTQFAVHQCSRFSADTKLFHEKGVKRICKYLKGKVEEGIILKANPERSIKCHVDVNFAGGWSQG